MGNLQTNLEKYADLILRAGLNIKPGDRLMLYINQNSLPLAREVTKRAYQLGVDGVINRFTDGAFTRALLEHGSETALTWVPDWQIQHDISAFEDNCHRLSIYAEDPHLLKGIDAQKISARSKATSMANRPVMRYTLENRVKWLVVAAAAPEWAQTVFPDLPVETAVEELWRLIFKATRVDQNDPIAAWESHDKSLKIHEKWLNDQNFASLHFKAPGTDLLVRLPAHHIWKGGSAKTAKGEKFIPNMPTEEIFSMPHAYGVDGTVRATLPLSLRGSLIDDFSFTFKDGEIVDFSAGQGEDVLRELLATDEGAGRLGEVALVSVSSPIYQSGVLFKNTLFDENAACHFALGAAYSENILNGATLTDEEKREQGMNTSMIHVDFMIGSAELDVTGRRADGTEVPILRAGEWVI